MEVKVNINWTSKTWIIVKQSERTSCTLRSWVHEIVSHSKTFSPRRNVSLTIFHTQNICHHAWKTVRTTLHCIVGLPLLGEGHKKKKNYGTNLSHCFFYFL